MPHQNSVFHGILKPVPWGEFDRIVRKHGVDKDDRSLDPKTHLTTMLYAQLSNASGLREIAYGMASHEKQLHHLGATGVAKSTLAEANRYRPAVIFTELFAAMTKLETSGYRREVGRAVRLIDSTTVSLSSLSRGWAEFSTTVFGVKSHVMLDPDADRPLYVQVTPSNVNDITVVKDMPIDAETDYVFDLGYYDFGFWARIHAAKARFVTRLKSNSPLTITEERPAVGSSVVSDRIGYLSQRLAAARKNPMSDLVREVRVRIQTGKILRVVTNDLAAPAQEIADLYKRRWMVELFFRWVKQTLKIKHFFGISENAVRIQIAVALIAYILLRLAQGASKIVDSALAFVRLIRVNLMHRRRIDQLLERGSQKADERQASLLLELKPSRRRRRPPSLMRRMAA
jgi:hypothetical protein